MEWCSPSHSRAAEKSAVVPLKACTPPSNSTHRSVDKPPAQARHPRGTRTTRLGLLPSGSDPVHDHPDSRDPAVITAHFASYRSSVVLRQGVRPRM